jgi:hypothetical protein
VLISGLCPALTLRKLLATESTQVNAVGALRGGLARERDGEVSGVTTADTDALRLALAMVRADWQDDEDSWDQLWAVADDRAELARVLTRMCRQNIDRLASVAGLSTAEMLHRMAGQLIPHPEPGIVDLVDLGR